MSEEHKLHTIEWDMMDRNKFLSLTVVNSFFLRTVIYPLVLVKTRLQVQKQNSVYSGSLDAFKKILKSEGPLGLYKGFWVNSIQISSGITYLVTYEKTRDLLTNYTDISSSRMKTFLSGGISSAVGQTLIIPFDIVSQHIMMALNTSRPLTTKLPAEQLKSTFFKPLTLKIEELNRYGMGIAITRQLYREGGLRSFYRGYFASILCVVPSSACWWLSYQQLNEYLFKTSMSNTMPTIFINCLSGTITGGAVSLITNPLDLLRANIQVHRPSSYRSAVKYLWKEDKWRIFTKGSTARTLQNCLSSGLVVIGYETLKRIAIVDEYRDQVRW